MNRPALTRNIPIDDQDAFQAAVREGIKAADAGKLSTFEPVAEWLASWETEEEPAPPK